MGTLILALLLSAVIVSATPAPDSKAVSEHSHSVTISTPLGSVQGSILNTRLGKHIFAFRGVRYAKAPVNELRFEPPVPIQKWEGVYNATVDGPSCIQPLDIDTSEDCLILNVYTTKLTKASENPKRPVMVFFHSGDFITGTIDSRVYGPKYLMDKDIVLVLPNYRLGPLGFLSTGTKEAPGNLGLKDQVEALKWVKSNIASFGGDPDSVTIAGHGSGGASVTLHMVSPLSAGLFHKAIVMSGSSLANIPVYTDQIELAKKQAHLVECDPENISNMLSCLKTKQPIEFTQVNFRFKEFGILDPHYVWLPVIESDFGQEQFLTEHPIPLINKERIAKVPLLAGITTDEFVRHAFAVIYGKDLIEIINADFDNVAPISYLFERDTDISRLISERLRRVYLKDGPASNASLPIFIQLYADGIAGFGVYRAVTAMVRKTKETPFYYRFNYKGRYSNFYLPNTNSTDPYGVAHGDDLIYLFHNSIRFPEFKDTDPELATLEKMTTMWANFVQKGNPTPDEKSETLDNVKWEPFSFPKRKFLDIGNRLVMSNNLYTDRYLEWDTLYPFDRIKGPTPKGDPFP